MIFRRTKGHFRIDTAIYRFDIKLLGGGYVRAGSDMIDCYCCYIKKKKNFYFYAAPDARAEDQ